MSKKVSARIRMYQVGELGDCFHLCFTSGARQSNVLIDCGSFRNGGPSITRMTTIVKHIKSQLKGKKLEVVVGTHQHNDHVSGYVHCEKDFTGIVQQVWLSWLDNPKDSLARRIKKDQMSLVSQLTSMNQKITSLNLGDNTVMKDMLGFYGVTDNGDPVIPAKGIANLKKMGANDPAYLLPGDQLDLPGLPPGEVKVYVLGPPRDQTLLFDINPKKGESYDPKLAIATTNAKRLLSAISNRDPSVWDREEEQFPFNKPFKMKTAASNIEKIYQEPSDSWRKIDNDWMEQANRIALYLDSYTNNCSLVLAFELVKTGKVLLFAADAQTGNWLSWENLQWEGMPADFTSNSLLANTVLYKVGHHASHNATLVKGLETMNHPDLVAMIPVDDSDGNITKKNGWKMPAVNLYQRLKEKTKFRVLRMDHGFADECDPAKFKVKAKAWHELDSLPTFDTKNYFIEYTVKG